MPTHVPFDVAALNEPMAVARQAVNRSQARPADKGLVFGAGPIGLGVPFADVQTAYDLAGTPGVADEVVVTFDD